MITILFNKDCAGWTKEADYNMLFLGDANELSA